MTKKQFKTESKRILDLMINSIYTNKEIFLRELISNASDAIDKRYFESSKTGVTGLNRADYPIFITADEKARTLTIEDKGIGMTKEELEDNLGTIAKSGTLNFVNENKEAFGEDTDIIGKFGVGFYSAFMVADKITVQTKAYGTDQAFEWESAGADGYTIKDAEKEEVGTKIILSLRPNTEDEDYDQFLKQYKINEIVKRYSDYIRYPIQMEVTKSREVEPEVTDEEGKTNPPKYESYNEIETLNSMVPLWRRSGDEVKPEDFEQFYMDKFNDYEKPLCFIHTKAEGLVSYNALLYIPSHTPYNYYSKEYEKGLELYSNSVMIMEKASDLIPDAFSFVKGLVDSPDLSLNISREMLQQDKQVESIRKSLEKKINSELMKLQKNDREKYDKFFKNFGMNLKFAIYNPFGVDKEKYQDLLMYYSLNQDKLITLAEYEALMKTEQQYIYYVCSKSAERAKMMPQVSLLMDKGFEVLCLSDDVDEFLVKVMNDYKGKQYKAATDKDADPETEEEKKDIEKTQEDNKGLLDKITEGLSSKVKSVRLSSKLKDYPCALTTDGALSLEMEKILNSMPKEANADNVKAERVLELNPKHPIFEKLTDMFKTEPEKVELYGNLLYNQALLIEGLPIEDPVKFANDICEIMK